MIIMGLWLLHCVWYDVVWPTGSYIECRIRVYFPHIREIRVSWKPIAAFIRMRQNNVGRDDMGALRNSNVRIKKIQWRIKFITSERRYFAYSVEWIGKPSTCYRIKCSIIPSVWIEYVWLECFIVSESNILKIIILIICRRFQLNKAIDS